MHNSSYEDIILDSQESMSDDCSNCKHKENCRNQCMKIEVHYNPNLRYDG